MSQANRIETMAIKLDTYARRAGVNSRSIVAAYRNSVALRLDVLTDVFHPDVLHPARCVLILLEDGCNTDETLLTAAALVETEFPAMRINDTQIRSNFGDDVANLVASVPVPDNVGDALAEELVLAPDDVGLLAVAERLDHARHLRFRDPSVWPDFHREIEDVYLPFARRVNGQLATRLARWSEAFKARELRNA